MPTKLSCRGVMLASHTAYESPIFVSQNATALRKLDASITPLQGSLYSFTVA